MKSIKSIGLSIILLLFLANPCFAEGQAGMTEFFVIIYSLSFCFYIITIGGIILLIRKILGLRNSKIVILIAFGIGLLLSILFYLIDSFYFIPIFWGIFN